MSRATWGVFLALPTLAACPGTFHTTISELEGASLFLTLNDYGSIRIGHLDLSFPQADGGCFELGEDTQATLGSHAIEPASLGGVDIRAGESGCALPRFTTPDWIELSRTSTGPASVVRIEDSTGALSMHLREPIAPRTATLIAPGDLRLVSGGEVAVKWSHPSDRLFTNHASDSIVFTSDMGHPVPGYDDLIASSFSAAADAVESDGVIQFRIPADLMSPGGEGTLRINVHSEPPIDVCQGPDRCGMKIYTQTTVRAELNR